MTEATISETGLTARFRAIHELRMRSLPVCNPNLVVETIGFRGIGPHRTGVLITPWFVNLVLLPGDDTWSDAASGRSVGVALPSGELDFTVVRDDKLGTYLSAVLFRSCDAFPDMAMARSIAEEVVCRLFSPPAQSRSDGGARGMTRRALLGGTGSA